MATSAHNSQSNSDEQRDVVPSGVDGPSAPTHVSSAGDALTDSSTPKSKMQTATTILFESGHRIRDYALIELLGQGGMGSVWKAKHSRLKKFVALKLLPQEKTSDAAAVARFHREMEAVGALKHPHIIEALDAGEENGTHYLVMEYVAGIELAELSKKVGPFPIADACELMRQTALGLQHAFEHGLVHRDIKPSNLLLACSPVAPRQDSRTSIDAARTTDPQSTSEPQRATGFPVAERQGYFDTPHIKILDLGLALLHGDQPGAELTSTGQVMGTLDYIAPEQLADTHAVDIRADLYSLGCTLFRLLTTEPPFAGPSLNTAAKKMFAHSFTPAPKLLDRRPDVPAELSALVARLLEKKPDARFATPIDVAAALAPFCVGHNLPALLASSGAKCLTATPSACAPGSLSPAPTPMALGLNIPADPFASTVIPHQHDAPASGLPQHDALRTGPTQPGDAPTSGLSSEPIVSQSFAQSTTEHSHSLARRAKSRRPLVIAGAILAIVLLSVFLPPLLKRDASQHDAPASGRILAHGEPEGVSPRTTTHTTDVRGLTPPGSPNWKSQISNSKSPPPTDPDRAAAEWLSRVGPAQRRPTNPPDATVNPDAGGPALEASLSHPANPVLLTGIDLSGLQTLNDADLARLADCTTLRDLQLHNTSLTGACLTHLQRLTRLRVLSLAVLPIEDQHLAALSELKQLEHLHLHNTKITDAGMPALAGLTELVTLSLKDTPISSVGLESLKRLPKLASLELTNTAAESSAVEVLCEFPALADVNLSNTRVTEADVKRLVQRPLPWHRLSLSNLPTVTDAILTDLRGQRELIALELGGTSVTAAPFETFVREHPRLGMTLPTDESAAPDLRVARRVLAAGGSVNVQIAAPQPAMPLSASVVFTAQQHVYRIEDLPKEPFRIRYIDLRPTGAKVTDESLAEVGRLEMLRDFNTQDANLSDLTILEVAAAPQLELLILNGSKLSPESVQQLATRTELTTLFLHNTGLTGLTTASLAALTKLRNLGIGSNPLTDDDIAFVEELTELETLHIAFTQIVNRGWASIARLPKLKQLYAYNMPVTDEAIRHAGQIESLEYLAIGGGASEVGDAGLRHLRPLRHLRELSISHCRRITDSGLTALAELPALETLHLNATPITDAGLKHLASIKTLKSLNLTECKLSEAALDDLQDALPWCRIQRP